jgi:hypothetical protein
MYVVYIMPYVPDDGHNRPKHVVNARRMTFLFQNRVDLVTISIALTVNYNTLFQNTAPDAGNTLKFRTTAFSCKNY